MEVEREEELISNTLLKQLTQLRKDKIDLENHLEQEQECMVNRLQRQVSTLQRENEEILKRITSERRSQTQFIERCLETVISHEQNSTQTLEEMLKSRFAMLNEQHGRAKSLSVSSSTPSVT
mmetsp:Transcript_22336/g.35739  ORF Transcript_22336/g.35739 Transcript_22336/m.35739 type:complete len:122 (+) Transcript_22336:269-634(+)